VVKRAAATVAKRAAIAATNRAACPQATLATAAYVNISRRLRCNANLNHRLRRAQRPRSNPRSRRAA